MDQIADVEAPRSEDPKLINYIVTFELTRPNLYDHKSATSLTDRRIIYGSDTALALRA